MAQTFQVGDRVELTSTGRAYTPRAEESATGAVVEVRARLVKVLRDGSAQADWFPLHYWQSELFSPAWCEARAYAAAFARAG